MCFELNVKFLSPKSKKYNNHYTITSLSYSLTYNEYVFSLLSPIDIKMIGFKNNNIFTCIPEQLDQEYFECIFKNDNLIVERIISMGHVTPEGEWYDQNKDEWVMLIQGQALVLFDHPKKEIMLFEGDYLLIPAHLRHRVEWTLPDAITLWLAIHF